MKRLITTTLLLSISLLFAQDKFDQAEEELQKIAPQDTTVEESKTLDEIVEEEDWKSRKPEEEDEDWWDDEWDDWREERKRDWKDRRHGYFRGGAGGWDFYYLPLNVAEINAKLEAIQLPPFDEAMYLSGGGGWGFIGHGIRVGGLGAHGRVVSSGRPGQTIAKDITLTINFGGFMIEKVFHPFNKSEIYFGATIGGGGVSLDMDQWKKPVDWDELWTGYDNAALDTGYQFLDYQNEIHSNFFTLLPTIGFRYNIFRWAAVGVNVGYLYTRLNQDGWKMDDKTVSDVPDMDFSNVIYRVNFYFGG